MKALQTIGKVTAALGRVHRNAGPHLGSAGCGNLSAGRTDSPNHGASGDCGHQRVNQMNKEAK